MRTFKQYCEAMYNQSGEPSDDLGATPDVADHEADNAEQESANFHWVYHNQPSQEQAITIAKMMETELAKEHYPWKYSGDADDEKVGFVWTSGNPTPDAVNILEEIAGSLKL